MEKPCGLFLFDTTSRALKAEALIEAAGIACAVIPTPVEFTAGCGISLLIDGGDVDAATGALSGSEGHRLCYPYTRGPDRGPDG